MNMKKEILSEIAIYSGEVKPPEGFEINRESLALDVLTSFPLLDVDPMDLIHSADYTLLYGIEVEKCSVRILYDDNRNTGRVRELPLKTNKFILFPSTQTYYIINNNRADSLNFIQTITYESI